jgi:hypothetical protein
MKIRGRAAPRIGPNARDSAESKFQESALYCDTDICSLPIYRKTLNRCGLLAANQLE